MEDNEILNLAIDLINRENIWFTTKNDPTFAEAPSYYELDEFGDPTDKAKKEIVKDITKFIGDGALDLEQALEMWKEECLVSYKLAFKEMLVTKFKDKPVVDQIEAYTNLVITESLDKVEEAKNFDLIIPTGLTDRKSEEVLLSVQGQLSDGIWENNAAAEKYWGYFNIIKDGGEICISVDTESYGSGFRGKTEEEVCKYIANKIKQIVKTEIDDGLDAIWDRSNTKIVDYLDRGSGVTVRDAYKVYDRLLGRKDRITEGKKERLEEENAKSLDIITSMFKANDFDIESKPGQIVSKTSTLFNVLSDAGYDVEVSFDNGESQSSILLKDQGAKIIVTITDPAQPLRAYLSGNMELTEDNINLVTYINKLVKSV